MDFITQDDCYLFGNGTHYKIYEKLGAHQAKVDGKKGTYFAVWAPNAVTVSVIGEFNEWSGFNHNMKRIENSTAQFENTINTFSSHNYEIDLKDIKYEQTTIKNLIAQPATIFASRER